MAIKSKCKVNHKNRVRFLQLDYYRQLVTGRSTKIEGIRTYTSSNDCVAVDYENGRLATYRVNEGEKQLKEVIKIINAYIGGTGDGTQQ